MYNTIGRIAGKIIDYKICKECGSINWYENESCVNCYTINTVLKTIFRPMTEKDAEILLQDYTDDECEMDI